MKGTEVAGCVSRFCLGFVSHRPGPRPILAQQGVCAMAGCGALSGQRHPKGQATVRVSRLGYGLTAPRGCHIHVQHGWSPTSDNCVPGSLVNKVGA